MAMYLVEFKSVCEFVTTAVGSPIELFEIIMILDNSSRVEYWRIIDYQPKDFGWSNEGWNKMKKLIRA